MGRGCPEPPIPALIRSAPSEPDMRVGLSLQGGYFWSVAGTGLGTVGLAGVSGLGGWVLSKPSSRPCAYVQRHGGNGSWGDGGHYRTVPPSPSPVPHMGRGAMAQQGAVGSNCKHAGMSERPVGSWESGILGGLTHDHWLASLYSPETRVAGLSPQDSSQTWSLSPSISSFIPAPGWWRGVGRETPQHQG